MDLKAGFKNEWRVAKNCFGGCAEASCPRLEECSSNFAFSGCPIGSPAFHQEVHEGHNTILNSFVNKIADSLAGVANTLDLNATMIAVGTGTGATTLGMTALQTELYRAAFVDRQRPLDGKVTFYWYFGTGVANGTLTEWAIMAGNPSAYPATDGIAINRFLSTITKTASDTVSGQYSITAAGV